MIHNNFVSFLGILGNHTYEPDNSAVLDDDELWQWIDGLGNPQFWVKTMFSNLGLNL